MRIRYIDLTDEQCDFLLKKYGYVKETLLAYYQMYGSDEEDDMIKPSASFNYTIAYKKGQRPAYLDGTKYPLKTKLNDYDYEKLIHELFIKHIFENEKLVRPL